MSRATEPFEPETRKNQETLKKKKRRPFRPGGGTDPFWVISDPFWTFVGFQARRAQCALLLAGALLNTEAPPRKNPHICLTPPCPPCISYTPLQPTTPPLLLSCKLILLVSPPLNTMKTLDPDCQVQGPTLDLPEIDKGPRPKGLLASSILNFGGNLGNLALYQAIGIPNTDQATYANISPGDQLVRSFRLTWHWTSAPQFTAPRHESSTNNSIDEARFLSQLGPFGPECPRECLAERRWNWGVSPKPFRPCVPECTKESREYPQCPKSVGDTLVTVFGHSRMPRGHAPPRLRLAGPQRLL